jgi:hypothetical protein
MQPIARWNAIKKASMPSTSAPFDAKARAEMKRWLDNWKRVGPILEAQRVVELRALTEVESARVAVELLWPTAPVGGGDDGEGLALMHAALRRLGSGLDSSPRQT